MSYKKYLISAIRISLSLSSMVLFLAYNFFKKDINLISKFLINELSHIYWLISSNEWLFIYSLSKLSKIARVIFICFLDCTSNCSILSYKITFSLPSMAMTPFITFLRYWAFWMSLFFLRIISKCLDILEKISASFVIHWLQKVKSGSISLSAYRTTIISLNNWMYSLSSCDSIISTAFKLP